MIDQSRADERLDVIGAVAVVAGEIKSSKCKSPQAVGDLERRRPGRVGRAVKNARGWTAVEHGLVPVARCRGDGKLPFDIPVVRCKIWPGQTRKRNATCEHLGSFLRIH